MRGVQIEAWSVSGLTLFEQYLVISSEKSPHSGLVDHLNLNPEKTSYHNIHLGNLNKNTLDVHDGEKWIKEVMTNAISSLINTKTDLIKKIFNKFRCFSVTKQCITYHDIIIIMDLKNIVKPTKNQCNILKYI